MRRLLKRLSAKREAYRIGAGGEGCIDRCTTLHGSCQCQRGAPTGDSELINGAQRFMGAVNVNGVHRLTGDVLSQSTGEKNTRRRAFPFLTWALTHVLGGFAVKVSWYSRPKCDDTI